MAQRRLSSRGNKRAKEMREEVIDSNVFIAAFLKGDKHHNKTVPLIEDLHLGKQVFHVSMLVPIEVCGAIIRRTKSPIDAHIAKRDLELWVKEGKIKLYELDRQRMDKAAEIAVRDELKGADAIIAQVAEELKLPLRTFDGEFSKRFKGAKVGG